MRRIFVSSLLSLAVLLGAASNHAQQSANGESKKRQDQQPAAQQPAPPPPAPPQEQNPQRQEEGPITQVVNLVDVLFTVLNHRNKLVPDLEKDDFKVWDDKAQQSIRYFSRQTD